MTQTGSPDPRIDLVCITSSCPRQFLQSSSGLTSFVARISNATTIALRCRRAGAVHSIINGHSPAFFKCLLSPQKQTSRTCKKTAFSSRSLMSSSSSNSRERSKSTPCASCVRRLNDTRLARTERVLVSCRSCNIFARRAHFTCHRSSKS
jgi:hypothetical protein